MQNLNIGMQITTISVLLAIGFLALIILRWHFQKTVIGKVFCEIITREGNEKPKLVPIVNGTLTLSPDKSNPLGRVFSIEDVATHVADYPPGWPPFMQAKCKKAVMDEESWEPLTNRKGILLLSPRRLFNIADEKFSATSVEKSREEMKDDAKIKHRSPNMNVWIIVGIVVLVAAIGAGIYFFKQNQDLQKQLKDAVGAARLIIGYYFGA